jgi:hypothetical protein
VASADGVISGAPLSEFQESLTEMASSIAMTRGAELAPEVPVVEHAAAEHVRRFSSEYFGISGSSN